MTNVDSNKRFVVPVGTINDKDRIRKDYGDIEELAESIKTLGLLQPIVVDLNGILIAGGRRLRAMRSLGWTDIPVTYFEVADPVTLRILEVEENVRRKPMSWQERVLAIADVHSKQALYKALAGERWTQQATGELLGESAANVSYALNLATYIRQGDKEIEKCPRLWDAIHLLVKRGAEESNRLLAKLTIPKLDPSAAKAMLEADLDDNSSIFTVPGASNSGGVSSLADDGEVPDQAPAGDSITIPLSQMCLRQTGNGDDISVIEQLPSESADHIITDWPYGTDQELRDQANDGASVTDVAQEHDVERNKRLQKRIIPHAFRLLKANGFFITWTDISVWQENINDCITAGFKVQPWPLIWYKTHRCGNQMALYNFTKNYEIAIVCRKGNATLLGTQESSIYVGANDNAPKEFGHSFAKPVKLWQWLYKAVAHKGQLVIDPFAGAGSSTIAAIEWGLQPLAIEVNEKHHNQQVVNVSEFYKKTLKNVKFT